MDIATEHTSAPCKQVDVTQPLRWALQALAIGATRPRRPARQVVRMTLDTGGEPADEGRTPTYGLYPNSRGAAPAQQVNTPL